MKRSPAQLISAGLAAFLVGCAPALKEKEAQDIKTQLADLQRSFVDLNLRMDNLDSRVEIVSQRTVEVDKRLQTVEQDKQKPLEITKIVPSTTDVPKPAPGTVPASEPKKVFTNESIAKMDPISLYNDAFGKFQKGKLDDAERGFKEFLELYPAHENADNATYWQGEVKYARGQFQDALQYFNRVIEQYPKGNKVPDALVKIGYCHLRLGEIEQAKSSFKRVIEEHPFSFAANQAQRKLEELK